MREITKGATSQTIYVSIADSTSTTGGKKTGLVFNTASLTGYYVRNQGSATAITLATLAAANSAWSSGGFKEVDATNMPGLYRLDIPDAAVAAGSGDSVIFTLKGATGMVQVDFLVQLVAFNNQDSVRAGLTALPNAAAEAAGGLYTRGTGAGQIKQTNNGEIDANATHVNNVATTSVTTINANVGTTQPVNFTGTGASALAKSDMVDVAGAAVSTSTAQIGVNAVNIGGTAQTGRDIGASVLLSSGTGTGQLDFTSGVVKANLAQILGTALTETAGLLAGGFKKFFNIATPAATMDHLVLVDTVTTYTGNTKQTGDNYARIGAPAGASVSADIAAVNAKTTNLPAAPASTTNITAGTITTVTNLTNAATAGDLTAAMIASVTAAATAATPTVTVSAASIRAAIGMASANMDSQLTAIFDKQTTMPPEVISRYNVIRVPLYAVLSSDHVSPATGKTIAIQLKKNGGALINPEAGVTVATEIGGGAYYVDLSATDTDTLGTLVVFGTAALTDNIAVFYDVQVPASGSVETSTIAPSGTAFLIPLDIGNRALQYVGAERMDAALGFTEPSKNAREVSFVYNKLRQAELRRNVWRFAIRNAVLRPIDTTTMLLAPSLWVSSTTYFAGSIVADENGTPWISRIQDNLGNDPLNSTTWEQYFGPLTVMLYGATATSYAAGELVYTTAGRGTNRTYISLQNGNADDPATATAWSATDTYSKDQVISYLSVAYQSKIDLNINQTPTASAADWAVGTTYAINDLVNGSDGVTYESTGNGNIAHDPVTDGGTHWTNTGNLTAWTTVFTGGTGSLKWLQIGGAEFPMGVGLATPNILYPMGSGPSSQDNTRNIYRLPAGFLRRAPRDPKAGATSYLGAPGFLNQDDWRFVGNYIVSSQVDTLLLWFVADTVDVAAMDPMFCEGLAARIALAICEPLTQSSDKLRTIASEYDKFMGEARLENGIETGSEEAPLDDYLATRG